MHQPPSSVIKASCTISERLKTYRIEWEYSIPGPTQYHDFKKIPKPKETRPKTNQSGEEDSALMRLEVFEAKVLEGLVGAR